MRFFFSYVKSTNGIIQPNFGHRQLCYICIHTYMCMYIVQLLSPVQLFATQWTASRQAPLFIGFPRKNTGVGCRFLPLGSSWPRDQTHVSCIGRWILCLWATREAWMCHCLHTNENSSIIIVMVDTWRPLCTILILSHGSL